VLQIVVKVVVIGYVIHLISDSKRLKVAKRRKAAAIKVMATAKSVSLFFMGLSG
jgi:hypothetical protein